ncbi:MULTISPECIES: cation transporter [unclassified Enterococcus]|uniref:cation transporter n=1 Tax=unclassified Enterococcus TaxID=2608891 RepID=UPI001551DE61|nr:MULTISPECIES: cation transporter [unclassified Enterococcus]MBS7576482.1 cation transporter [Enterococcus sp. MMGLQ5-2]MBS7583714.1 cation transporter [Enterococcus sp. MMGLQ5-1]NPD11575.1 cation transporter [Enterococcus sp. MMGLQ5-1]NPD36319.1 cation transporter [Enterococcus sp. MMGLQ5-2]
MIQKQIEKRALIVSTFANFIIAGAGFWAYQSTGLQALFLDFFFSLIAFISLIFAIIISNFSHKKTKTYPDGLFFLEPLYAILKSLLVIVLLVTSVWTTFRSALAYFFDGTGSVMNLGPILPYTSLMVILCFGLGIFNHLQNKKINRVSVILNAESKSNLIDGVQSLGIGIAVLILLTIDINGPLGFLHYTGDFFITAILSMLSIKEPIKILISSFIELSKGTTKDLRIKKMIDQTMKTNFGSFASQLRYEIYKTGTSIRIEIVLTEPLLNQKILAARDKIQEVLTKTYENVTVRFQF